MAGSARKGTGIFKDCSRRGQEADRGLYRTVKYDLQRHKGRSALRDYEYVKRRIE